MSELLHGSDDGGRSFATALFRLLLRSGNEAFSQTASSVLRKRRREQEDKLWQSTSGKCPRQALSRSSAAPKFQMKEGSPPADPESRPAKRQPSNAFEFLHRPKSRGQNIAGKQAAKRRAEVHAEQPIRWEKDPGTSAVLWPNWEGPSLCREGGRHSGPGRRAPCAFKQRRKLPDNANRSMSTLV